MSYQAFDIQGLDGVLRKLQELPKEVTQKRGGPVRSSLRKGAHVIRKQAQANVRRIAATPNKRGGDKSTGELEKSIRVLRGRPHKTLNGERMFVLVPKRRRYPVSRRNPPSKAQPSGGMNVSVVGRMLEYGTAKRPKMPWMGPAFHSKKQEAVQVVVKELHKGIDRIVKKLSKQP